MLGSLHQALASYESSFECEMDRTIICINQHEIRAIRYGRTTDSNCGRAVILKRLNQRQAN